MRTHIVLPSLAFGLLLSTSVFADESPPPSPPPGFRYPAPLDASASEEQRANAGSYGGVVVKDEVRRWYGWQTLIGVLVSDIAMVAGVGSPISYLGLAGHVVTGPIVHWVHGHVGRGFASLGLTAGLPLASAATGAFAGRGGFDSLGYALLFGGVGLVAGATIDIAALSTETISLRPNPSIDARSFLPSSIGIVPMMDKHIRGLSLVGQF